jgi:hypothetical protein
MLHAFRALATRLLCVRYMPLSRQMCQPHFRMLKKMERLKRSESVDQNVMV